MKVLVVYLVAIIALVILVAAIFGGDDENKEAVKTVADMKKKYHACVLREQGRNPSWSFSEVVTHCQKEVGYTEDQAAAPTVTPDNDNS